MNTTSSGLQYEDLQDGTGLAAKAGDTVDVHYTGWLKNGKKFEREFRRAQEHGDIPPDVDLDRLLDAMEREA